MKRVTCPDCGRPVSRMGNDMFWCEECREEKLILFGPGYILTRTWQPPTGAMIWGAGRGA